MKDYGEEKVLVVPKQRIPHWEGVITASLEILKLLRENSFFILRNRVEGDTSFKQIIPYCILIHTDQKGIKRLFYAQRGADADRELAHKWTIGLGGHINLQDSSPIQFSNGKVDVMNLDVNELFDITILNCAKRELNEEVKINWDDVLEIRYLALIFTESNTVSREHMAVVLQINLATRNVKVKEEFIKGGFFTPEEFLIYTEYSDWLLWLHTPEGQEMEKRFQKLRPLSLLRFSVGPTKKRVRNKKL